MTLVGLLDRLVLVRLLNIWLLWLPLRQTYMQMSQLLQYTVGSYLLVLVLMK